MSRTESLGVSAVAAKTDVSVLRTVLVADLVNSTALIDRLGDVEAARLMAAHDRAARGLHRAHHALEIDRTDGFLLLFERPADALAWAVAYLQLLEVEFDGMRARVGLHLGNLVLHYNTSEDIAANAKPIEAEGLAKPTAARLAQLALPGQILLSGETARIARRGQDGPGLSELVWRDHGRYRLKGISESIEVVEAGETGRAPLRKPPSPSGSTRLLTVAVALASAVAVTAILLTTLANRHSLPIDFQARDFLVLSHLENLTGDSVFDRSVEQALRQGLEQTRFINVLGDAQLRDAVRRMRLDPDTPIDAEIAVEIAQREGAKAVLRPMLMGQSQGSLRLGVELLAAEGGVPLRTFWTDTERGRLLQDIDGLVGLLRRELGESLESIQSSSTPLLRVTTPNLEALRAYSLSHESWVRGDFQQAIGLIEHALRLEPEFAMAHARLGTYHYSLQQLATARPHLQRALELSDRLVERERLYVEAAAAMYGPPAAAVDAWRLLGTMYPELGAGQHNSAYILYQQLDRCEQALPLFQQAAATRVRQNYVAAHFAGLCALRLDDYDASARAFEDSMRLGDGNLVIYGLVDLHTARRDYAAADAVLAGELPAAPYLRFAALQRKTALLVDQGRLQEALLHLDEVISQSVGQDPAASARAEAARLAVLWGLGDERLAAALQRVIDTNRPLLEALLAGEVPTADLTPFGLVVSAGIIAARSGHFELAAEAHGVAAASEVWREVPMRAAHLRVLELLLAQRDSALAAGLLGEPLVLAQQGVRLLQEDWERMQSRYAGTVPLEPLLAFADQRGRALAEWNDQQIEQVANLLLMRLAGLEAARQACASPASDDCARLSAMALAGLEGTELSERSPLHGAIRTLSMTN